jgi:trehalose/maltose hydrolase-like predicted phosphorylase
MDVDGISATTAHGLHVATMGGVWLALVEGFAGIQPDGEGLRIRPRLPAAWQEVTVHLVYRGVRVQIHIRDEEVRVGTDRPLPVVIARD